MNKKLFFIFGIFLGIILIGFISAETESITPQTYNTDASRTTPSGMRFYSNQTIFITELFKESSLTANRVFISLDFGTGTILGNASFVGNKASFSPNLKLDPSKIYYLSFDSEGSGYTPRYSASSSVLPQNTGFLNFTSGFNHLNDTNYRSWNLQNITFSILRDHPEITLNSPINSYNTTSQTINFNVTVTDNSQVENVSLYINGILNETNTSQVNGTYIFTKTFSDGEYNWSILAYDNESQDTQSATRTFNITKILENSIDYQTSVLEGVSTTILQNISLDSSLSITSANFYYNGTAISISPSFSGGYYILSNTFTTPLVTTIETIPFYFEILLNDSTTNNLTSYNQTVSPIGIDNCSTYTNVLYNFTIYSETEETFLNGSSTNTFSEVEVIIKNLLGLQTVSFNQEFSQSNPFQICVNNNLSSGEIFQVDLELKYTADNFEIEYYNIQSDILNSSSLYSNISLYLLNSSLSTEFQLSFRDENGLYVDNAVVLIQRKYLSQGLFKTVEAPKTDTNGQTVVHLVEKDVIYNIIIQKEGVVLATFENVIPFCEDATIGLCRINLISSETDTEFFNYDSTFEINYDATYNETTRELSFTFTTKDNIAKNVTIIIYKFDMLGGEYLHTNGVVSSSGEFIYTIPESVGNSTYFVNIYVDGELMQTFFVDGNLDVPYGKFGYLVFFFLLISIVLMFSESKTMVVAGSLLAFVFGSILSIISTGSVGTIAGLVWLIVGGIVLIFKLNQQGTGGGN